MKMKANPQHRNGNRFWSASLLTLTLLMLTTACTSGPKWMKGQWSGTGYQIDGKYWEMSLDARRLRNILVDYPGLDCGGKWEIEVISDQRANGTEILKYGFENCNNNGELVITPSENGKIHIEFYLKEMGKQVIAVADLDKTE